MTERGLNERRFFRLLATPRKERGALVDSWDREDEALQRFFAEQDHKRYEERLYRDELEVRVWRAKPWWLRPFTKPDTFALELAGRLAVKHP